MNRSAERIAGYWTLFLVLSLFLPVCILAQVAPKIEAVEPEFDFGTVYRGGTVKHVFTLRNAGADTLRIENVRSSCGCTVAMVDKHALAPGESTSIQADFDSRTFVGRVRKDIYVQTNDPDTPITKLSIGGEVLVDLNASPSRVYFSGMREGERLERKITLQNMSETTINIKEVSSTVPDLRFELVRLSLKPGESVDMLLIVDKVTRDTRLTGELTVHHTSPQKELTIQLYGGAVN